MGSCTRSGHLLAMEGSMKVDDMMSVGRGGSLPALRGQRWRRLLKSSAAWVQKAWHAMLETATSRHACSSTARLASRWQARRSSYLAECPGGTMQPRRNHGGELVFAGPKGPETPKSPKGVCLILRMAEVDERLFEQLTTRVQCARQAAMRLGLTCSGPPSGAPAGRRPAPGHHQRQPSTVREQK